MDGRVSSVASPVGQGVYVHLTNALLPNTPPLPPLPPPLLPLPPHDASLYS